LRESQRLTLGNLRRGADLLARFKRTAVHQSEAASRPFDLLETINDVLACLRGEFKRLAVVVDVRCPEGVEVVGSPGSFEQMLTNLLLNSVRHGFENGARSGRISIDVRIDPERNRLHIDLADDGVGIPEALQERVFEPFFTTRRGDGGSGLGLFIVYNIVTRQFGGTVRCESVSGRGTTIRIEIPHPAGHALREQRP
jgi:signal transduction histidine kinase